MKPTLLLVLALAVTATACKKKSRFSSNCSRDLELVSPWTEWKLPTGVPDSRVCSVNELKLDVEYLADDRGTWEKQYETAMVAAGFAKERCSSLSCSFVKAGEKINVQVNQVSGDKRPKTIVHLTRTPAKVSAGSAR